MNQSAPPVSAASASHQGIVRIESETLFKGRRQVVILHQGAEYRLQITKMDKLILTK